MRWQHLGQSLAGRSRAEPAVAGSLPTVDEDVLGSLAHYFADRADHPFGDVELLSGQTLQPFSIAGQEAASNLLNKARRALNDGDLERAREFVDRAVQLPYDKHEEAAPVAIAAHMDLFCLVIDTLESAETHDSRWLDCVLKVLATSDESTRCVMRDVLSAIDQDYSLNSGEHAALRAAVAAIPNRPELRDLHLSTTELGDQIMSILALCREYQAALATPS